MSSPDEFTPEQEEAAARRLFSASGRQSFSNLVDELQRSGLGTQADELEGRYDELFLESLHISVDDQEEGGHDEQ